MRNKAHLLTAASAASLLLAAAPGHAATATAAASADTAEATKVGEIVITAERREENLQTTPIAVSAQTGAQLQAQGVTGFQQLGQALGHLPRRARIDPALGRARRRPCVGPREDRQIAHPSIATHDLDHVVHAHIAPAVHTQRCHPEASARKLKAAPVL